MKNGRMAGRKGMGIEQAFIFIVVAITFAVIMVFGYKAITDFLQSGEEIGFVQFKNDLETDVKRISTEFGSVREKEYQLPPTYQKICFVNLNQDYTPQEIAGLCIINVAACSVWEEARRGRIAADGTEVKGYAAVDENVFLQPPAPSTIKIYRFSLAGSPGFEPGFICPAIHRGTLKLRLEGKGSYTLLSEATVQ